MTTDSETLALALKYANWGKSPGVHQIIGSEIIALAQGLMALNARNDALEKSLKAIYNQLPSITHNHIEYIYSKDAEITRLKREVNQLYADIRFHKMMPDLENPYPEVELQDWSKADDH